VDFTAAKYVAVSSTCYPYKEIYKRKWRSPDDKTSNNVHHIKIDNRIASSIMDMKSCSGANSHSDHFLGQGKCRFKIAYRTHEICKCHKKLM
jgi:hypothetical protein